jgi:hypothetical protein
MLACTLNGFQYAREDFPSQLNESELSIPKSSLNLLISVYEMSYSSMNDDSLFRKSDSIRIEMTLTSFGLHTYKEIMKILLDFRNPKKGLTDNCYIATATMGDMNHPYVVLLRAYRDNVLMKTNLGKLLILCYYKISPCLAAKITNNAFLKRISCKFIVHPAYLIARKTMANSFRKNEE